MNTKQKRLIERLRLEVVCPAKARIKRGKNEVTLMSCNYRFLGRDEISLRHWHKLFRKAGLNLEIELSKLVKSEIGSGFDIKKESYSGYLGVTSDTWIEIVKIRQSRKDRKVSDN